MSKVRGVFLQVTFALTALCFASEARAHFLQAEADLQPHFQTVPASTVRIGLLLGPSFAVESGFGFSAFLADEAAFRMRRSFQVPLELVYYTREAEPQTVVPSLRAGLGYSRAVYDVQNSEGRSGRVERDGWTASALLGLNYFVHASFAISAQYGARYFQQLRENELAGFHSPDEKSLSSEARLGVVLRL